MDILQLITLLGIVLLYFLLVYLLAVRRGGQRLFPWILLILVQTASLYFYKEINTFISGLSFPSNLSETGKTVMTIGVLTALNFLIILFTSALCAGRGKEKEEPRVEMAPAVFASEDLPPITLDLNESKDAGSDQGMQSMNINPVNLSQDDEDTGKNGSDEELQSDDERIFQAIEKMIEQGDHDAASNYLKTVAFFGKKKAIVDRAKQMLNEMQTKTKEK